MIDLDYIIQHVIKTAEQQSELQLAVQQRIEFERELLGSQVQRVFVDLFNQGKEVA